MGLVNTFDGGRVVSGQDTGANGSEVERTLLFQEEDNNARARLSAAETSEATSSRPERCLNCPHAYRRERRKARVRSRREGSFNFKGVKGNV